MRAAPDARTEVSMRASPNRLRSALFVLLALGLALSAMAATEHSAQQALPAATSANTCTAWLFDGCCPQFQERQKRTCTTSTGVSFTETRCIVVPECI